MTESEKQSLRELLNTKNKTNIELVAGLLQGLGGRWEELGIDDAYFLGMYGAAVDKKTALANFIAKLAGVNSKKLLKKHRLDLFGVRTVGDFANIRTLWVGKWVVGDFPYLQNLKYCRKIHEIRIPADPNIFEYLPETDAIREVFVYSPYRFDKRPEIRLDFLQKFPKLEVFVADRHIKITDLSGLRGLEGLRRVDLSGTELQSLESLSGAVFPNLKFLDISYNSLQNLDHFPEIGSYFHLNACYNRIERIDGLQNPEKILTCGLSHNLIQDISRLKTCIGILELGYNRIETIEPLRGAPIRKLNLRKNPLKTGIPIRELPRLNWLYANQSEGWSDSKKDRAFLSLLPKERRFFALKDSFVWDVGYRELASKRRDPWVYLAGRIKYLNLSKTRVQSLEFLSYFKAVEELRLSNCGLEEVEGLRGLLYPNSLKTDLQVLMLAQNRIVDLSPLADFTQIRALSLARNPCSDISVLKNLKSLNWLSLAHSPCSDISVLKNLKSLNWLDLSFTQTEDLSVLESLKNLEYLDISHTKVVNIEPILELPKLKILRMRHTLVSDLRVLNGCVCEWVHISKTQFEPKMRWLFAKENPKCGLVCR